MSLFPATLQRGTKLISFVPLCSVCYISCQPFWTNALSYRLFQAMPSPRQPALITESYSHLLVVYTCSPELGL